MILIGSQIQKIYGLAFVIAIKWLYGILIFSSIECKSSSKLQVDFYIS